MDRLELYLTYVCNLDCIFCNEQDVLSQFKYEAIDIDQVLEILKSKRNQGFSKLTLVGSGEPSIDPYIVTVLKTAKAAGYITTLVTNGISFGHEKICQQILPLIDELSFSIHSVDKDVYETLSRIPQSYNLMMQGFKNIYSYAETNPGFRLFCNAVVSTKNIDSISAVIDYLRSYPRIEQLLISNCAPEGGAGKNYQELAVSYTAYKQMIPHWVEKAKQADMVLRFFGLPMCVLGDYSALSNDLNWDERISYKLQHRDNGIGFYEMNSSLYRDKKKLDVCTGCRYNDICSGVFEKYIDLFGFSEIIPFT